MIIAGMCAAGSVVMMSDKLVCTASVASRMPLKISTVNSANNRIAVRNEMGKMGSSPFLDLASVGR